MFVLVKEKTDITYIIVAALVILVFYYYLYPALKNNDILMFENFNSSLSVLADGKKVSKTMCSKDCCGPDYPTPFNSKTDPRIKEGDVGTKYFPSNYTCLGNSIGDKGVGCVCLSKDQHDYLAGRGENN